MGMSRIKNVWKSDEKTNLETRNKCSGCGACENSCPKQAISMKYDNEGFLYPKIDENRCIDCEKCIKVCPMSLYPESKDYLKTYAGYSNKAEIIDNCASGGICTAISEYIINQGGIVFGVKYTDDFIKAEYSKAETSDELKCFMTSKYVQSTKKNIYSSIKEEIRKNRLVAFIGCPCDVAALHLYLGRDYENLFTCELVCMGVTSYKVAEEYITQKEKKWGTLTGFNSKGKKYGWFVPCLEETYSKGKKISKSFYGTYYGFAFTKFQRPSCSQCPYRGKIGYADIRMGDFWGIKKTDEFWNEKGVSSIFVRTQKGFQLLEYIKDEFSLYEVNYEKAAVNNNMDLSKNYNEKQLEARQMFSDVFLTKGLVAACRKYATKEFWIKYYVPLIFANTLKHLRHLLTDKKTK